MQHSTSIRSTEDGGMQVLVVIDGPDAPTEYRFDMTVPVGAVLLSRPMAELSSWMRKGWWLLWLLRRGRST
jgi:hypothetical protein